MKKSALLILLTVFLSCSATEDELLPDGDTLLAVSITDWRDVGKVCEAPRDVNGIAELQLTFNGGVPSGGSLTLQSKWKLPSETDFTYEDLSYIGLEGLSSSGADLTITNGYCWGADDSSVFCEFKYILEDGTETEVITISIPRPE